MRALRFHGVRQLNVETIPAPGITGPGEVRLRVEAAGICGSDLHNYSHGQWISKLPVTPGHEFAGVVLESRAAGFKPGDLVVADSRVACGACPACLAGRRNLCARLGFVGEVCDGGFAEETVLPATGLYHVPAGVDPRIAAMTEPLAVAQHAINQLEPVMDAPILITGGGPIGGLVALLLAQSGFGPLLLVERNPHRAGLLAEIADARAVTLDDCPEFGLAVDATGAAGIADFLYRRVAAGGRLAMVGLFHAPLNLDLNVIVEREITVRGCSVFRDEMRDMLPRLGQLAPKLTALTTPPIGLGEMPRAYEQLLAGETRYLKTIVAPNA